MRRKRLRRWLLFIPCAVILGMATSVGIGWLIAWRSDPPPVGDRFGFSAVEGDCWYVRRSDARGVVRLDGKAVAAWVAAGRQGHDPSLVPPWSRFDAPPTAADFSATNDLIELGYGWPRIAVSCTFRQRSGNRFPVQFEILGGWSIEPDPQKTRNQRTGRVLNWESLPRVLAFRPYWPGLILNGVFLSPVWMIAILLLARLAAAPFALRRWRRRTTGRCIKCGYDLRGDLEAGCPECGWRRPE